MVWVIVFAAIAVAGLIMVGCYAVWLVHKTADVMSEVTVLASRGGELVDLLGQIQQPTGPVGPDETRDVKSVDATRDRAQLDVG